MTQVSLWRDITFAMFALSAYYVVVLIAHQILAFYSSLPGIGSRY